MEIKDLRNTSPGALDFQQLKPGSIVQGVETGTIYYVAAHHGGTPAKRLVNFNKQAIQDSHHTGGRYRRIQNAVLELRPE